MVNSTEALDMEFITTIVNEKDSDKASQSVKKSLISMIVNSKKDDDNKDNDDTTENDDEPKELNMSSFLVQ